MDLVTLMDKTLNGYGEMDIAIIVMTLYKDNLPKGKDLYIKLNNNTPAYFLERATFWTQQAMSSPDALTQEKCIYNAKKLHEISLKFKETKFKKAIMEEIEYLTST